MKKCCFLLSLRSHQYKRIAQSSSSSSNSSISSAIQQRHGMREREKWRRRVHTSTERHRRFYERVVFCGHNLFFAFLPLLHANELWREKRTVLLHSKPIKSDLKWISKWHFRWKFSDEAFFRHKNAIANGFFCRISGVLYAIRVLCWMSVCEWSK